MKLRSFSILLILATALTLVSVAVALPDVLEEDSFSEKGYEMEDDLYFTQIKDENHSQESLVDSAVQAASNAAVIDAAVKSAVMREEGALKARLVDNAVTSALTSTLGVTNGTNTTDGTKEVAATHPPMASPPPINSSSPNAFHLHHHDCKFACPGHCGDGSNATLATEDPECKACADCKAHLDHGKGLIEAVAKAHEEATATLREKNLRVVKKVREARKAAAKAVLKFAKLPVGAKKKARLAKAKAAGLTTKAAQKKEARHREKKTMKKVRKAAILSHIAEIVKQEASLEYNRSVQAHAQAERQERVSREKAANATRMEAFALNRLRSADQHPNAEDFSKWGDDGRYRDMNKAVRASEALRAVKHDARVALDNATIALREQERLLSRTRGLENAATKKQRHYEEAAAYQHRKQQEVINRETRAQLDAEAKGLSFRDVRPPTPSEEAGLGHGLMEGTWYDNANNAARQNGAEAKAPKISNMLEAEIETRSSAGARLRTRGQAWANKSQALHAEAEAENAVAESLRKAEVEADRVLRKATMEARTGDYQLKTAEEKEIIAVMKDADSLKAPISRKTVALHRLSRSLNASFAKAATAEAAAVLPYSHAINALTVKEKAIGTRFSRSLAKALNETRRYQRSREATRVVGQIQGTLHSLKSATHAEELTAEEEIANAKKEKGFAYQIQKRLKLKALRGRSKAQNATVAMLEDVRAAALAAHMLAEAKSDLKSIMKGFDKAKARDGLNKLRMAKAALGEYIPNGRVHMEAVRLPNMTRRPTDQDIHTIEAAEKASGALMNAAEILRENATASLTLAESVEKAWEARASNDTAFKTALKKYEADQAKRRRKLLERQQKAAAKADERALKAKERSVKHLTGAEGAMTSIDAEERRLKVKERLRYLKSDAGKKLFRAVGEEEAALSARLQVEEIKESTIKLRLRAQNESDTYRVLTAQAHLENLRARREEELAFVSHLKEDVKKFPPKGKPNPPMPPVTEAGSGTGLGYRVHKGIEGVIDRSFAKIAQPHAAHGDTIPSEQVGAVTDVDDPGDKAAAAETTTTAAATTTSLLAWYRHHTEDLMGVDDIVPEAPGEDENESRLVEELTEAP